jgi:hypothetical protein
MVAQGLKGLVYVARPQTFVPFSKLVGNAFLLLNLLCISLSSLDVQHNGKNFQQMVILSQASWPQTRSCLSASLRSATVLGIHVETVLFSREQVLSRNSCQVRNGRTRKTYRWILMIELSSLTIPNGRKPLHHNGRLHTKMLPAMMVISSPNEKELLWMLSFLAALLTPSFFCSSQWV